MRTLGISMFVIGFLISFFIWTPTLDFLYERRVDHARWDRGGDAILKFMFLDTSTLSPAEKRRYKRLKLGNAATLVLCITGVIFVILS